MGRIAGFGSSELLVGHLKRPASSSSFVVVVVVYVVVQEALVWTRCHYA